MSHVSLTERAERLVPLLAEPGNVGELRGRAHACDAYAADRLTAMLAQQGRVDALTDEVNAGTYGAGDRLIQLFKELREPGRASQLRSRGIDPDELDPL